MLEVIPLPENVDLGHAYFCFRETMALFVFHYLIPHCGELKLFIGEWDVSSNVIFITFAVVSSNHAYR